MGRRLCQRSAARHQLLPALTAPRPCPLRPSLLGAPPSFPQWASIPVLAAGVVLVTVNNGAGATGAQSAAAAAVSSSSHGLDYVAGMVACSVSGLSSAYAGERAGGGEGAVGGLKTLVCRSSFRSLQTDPPALSSALGPSPARPSPPPPGVYFEKFVKGKHAASLWVRNIQLGMYGVPLR